MPNGYMGTILWIDLSEDSFREENLSEKIYRQYLGGYGLASKLVYENLPPKIESFDPEALLGFFPGLFTGTIAPMTGRFMVVGKSPLTGTWGDSNCGGYFGPEIKKCGYDAIIVKGRANEPKYILINNGEKQILDASNLWGLDVVQTEEKLHQKYGNVQVMSIGQAGEKRSLISGIVNDKARIAARSGLGALMGSKNLKAIVLRGNKKIEVSDKDTLIRLTKEYNKGINSATTGAIVAWKEIGTAFANVISAQLGDTPIKNWGGTIKDFPMEKISKISGEELIKYRERHYGCFSCPIQCGGIMNVPDLGLKETHQPEYETCASFGHLLLNDDLMSLFMINDLCNRAGIDTISTGTAVAFAIECYENEILSKEDTGGLNLTWGNSEAIIELVKNMIRREGLGELLADGVKIASEKINGGSKKYAIHAMGQEPGMHSPKYYKSLGMSYAFDPTPGRHTVPSLDMMAGGPLIKPNGLIEGITLPKKFKRPGHDRSEAEKLGVAIGQVMSSIGLCEFAVFFQKYPLIELFKAIVGWDINIDELIRIGLRIYTLRHSFNLREGIDIINNKLPDRIVDVNYLEDYKGFCEVLGWNPNNAYPSKNNLSELKLDFVIKDLY
ncbi:MAG: aldehyde ferredoxin oxidoreductase [Promethearchaeota archaeon]|nr:MAG: aldehyde ferredoxin oxidoreductase [Candidatus Lokiarchaeota archaeon]